MFADQLVNAAASSRRTGTLDQIARLVWRAYAAGHLTDDQAAACSSGIEARRAALRDAATIGGTPSPDRIGGAAKPGKRHPRSPDRARSLQRRRMIASSGMLPPHLACEFTIGEQATLATVARAVVEGGACTMTVDEIAGRAGVSASTVRNAVRVACRAGMLIKIERRVCYDRNLPNVLKIISREWSNWLATRSRQRHHVPVEGGGCRNLDSTSARSRTERGLAMNRGRDRGLTPRARRDL